MEYKYKGSNRVLEPVVPNDRLPSNGEILVELHNAVRSSFDRKRSIDSIVKTVLKETRLEKHVEIRRDHDGVSSAEYLVEKMIGEMLIEGSIKW